MKKIKPFFVCLSLIVHSNLFSQQETSNAVQITTEYNQETEKLSFIGENQDLCDYVVCVILTGQTRFIIARPGKSELFNVKIAPGTSYAGYRFAMYRGTTDLKPNIDFTYCLPISKGDSLAMTVNFFSNNYQMDFIVSSDSIFAIRDGVVCNDDLKDFTEKGYQHFNDRRFIKQITIYHKDGTFGEYVFVGKPLVSRGSKVKMGQPIADIGKYGRFSLSLYFLDKNKLKNISIGNKHTHFRPFFQTSNEGKVRLNENEKYYCELDNEMLMQDMNKREQKKFNKIQINEKL